MNRLLTPDLLTAYRKLSTELHYTEDSAQLAVIDSLQTCLKQLHQRQSWFRKPIPVPGVYLWGPVGRGKTILMDLFCESLSQLPSLRLHYHRFMAMVHQQLSLYSGKPDPLSHIAKTLKQYSVICLDEFFVSDIGDAMLLGRLCEYLFAEGLVLVCTSNTRPDNLYSDGLHRDRFLPAIDQIHRHMQVISLDNGVDHRLRHRLNETTYFLNQAAEFSAQTRRYFSQASACQIQLCDRTVPCIASSAQHIWFSFGQLCTGPRSALDYIELAENYTDVFISDVPTLGGQSKEHIKARGTEDGSGHFNSTGMRRIEQTPQDDPARRFIALVDELYDNRVNLYISTDTALNELYQGELLQKEFQRTRSRLQEMASHEYISQQPRESSARKDLLPSHGLM